MNDRKKDYVQQIELKIDKYSNSIYLKAVRLASDLRLPRCIRMNILDSVESIKKDIINCDGNICCCSLDVPIILTTVDCEIIEHILEYNKGKKPINIDILRKKLNEDKDDTSLRLMELLEAYNKEFNN